MKRLQFFLIVAALFAMPLGAQPMLVADINPGSSGSVPAYLTAFDGMVYFRANNGTNGAELWKSDGTEAGTALVRDIWPGPIDGLDGIPAFAPFFGALGGSLYFMANEGTNGDELWRTDGTEAGTMLAVDINPGPNASGPFGFTEFDGMLYFRASDGTNGTELWRTDGTEAGTMLVKDTWPGAPGGVRSIPEFTPFGGVFYFSADDGTNGLELWRSDGTEAGTMLLKDIDPGPGDGMRNEIPSEYTPFNGALYFAADDGTTGRELWRSDGTEAGTVRVADIFPGSEASEPSGLTVFGGMLYFSADDGTNGVELWKSDGTEAGTVLVKDINPGSESNDPFELTEFGGILYFTADDGVNGRELWRSDGTEAGTMLVKDINPGPGDNLLNGLSLFTVFEGTLYFRANNGTNGLEMWRTDGTEAGTVLVADINPGSGAGAYNEPIVFQGAFFFQANDGTNGQELWVLPGISTPNEAGSEIPNAFHLSAAYPNPFNPSTTFTLDIPETGYVVVDVLDALGRRVAVLHEGNVVAGSQTLRLEADNLPSGVYVVRAIGAGAQQTRSVTLLR